MVIKRKPAEKEKQQGISPAAAYDIPQDAIESLARCLYPAIRAYFESEDGQREWGEWQNSHPK